MGRVLAVAAAGVTSANAAGWLGHAFLPWHWPSTVGTVGLAVAALAHSWVHGWTARERNLRRLGYVAAGGALGVALLVPMPLATAVCMGLLALSLLLKARVLPMAVAADLAVFFYCSTRALTFAFGIAPDGASLSPLTAAAFAALAAAWMLMWPELRPAAYFLERGSAGALMRWLLPVTLVYPVLLGALPQLRATNHPSAAQATTFVVLYGTVLFVALLLWLISRQLDIRDFETLVASAGLRASEERYRLMFEASPLPMWIFDRDSLCYLAVNESAIQRYGYSRAEFLGMTALDLRPANEHEDLRAAVGDKSRASGRRWTHVTKSGERVQVEVFAHEVEWQGRRANLSYIQDVTERLEQERQLRESEAQVRILLESTSEGIFATDLNARCIWCNPAAVKLLGYDRASQILGRNMHVLAHHTRPDGTPYPEEECKGKHAAHRGEPYTNDDDLLWRADGTALPVAMRSAPLMRDGRNLGTVVTFVDTTERRKLQAQFQQAQKMEAVGRLAAGVAHDFNNLLTVINGYAEMLIANPAWEPIHAKLAAIRRAGERGAILTRQLLSFSRMQMVEPRTLDLNQAVSEAQPLLKQLAGASVRLQFELGEGLPAVRADAVQIGQVLMNLVSNAYDAITESGSIVIRTGMDGSGDQVILSVRDDGSGMDAATRERLFEPFFTTKPQGKGTGLGLSTVYGIVHQFGGSLGVESELGQGTTISIRLAAVAEATDPHVVASAVEEAGSAGDRRVLVVEDDEIVRNLACEVLLAEGFRVESAGLPSEGQRRFQADPDGFDLLLTDVVMPEFNGRKLAARLHALRPDLPVLYMSGYTDNALGGEGKLDAGLAFIAKPFTPAELVRKVREVMRGAVGAAQG